MEMIHLFAGYDPREKVGFHVFCHSVISRATRPVSITPLAQMGLGEGSNAFTLSRFLVPFLMGFKGHAIFCDASDMLCMADIAELDALFDPQYAVQVVKHADYETKNPMKYVGTPMECVNRDYSRKNWASVMLINAEAPEWRGMTPENLKHFRALELLQFDDIEAIGALPGKWNCILDEGQDHEGAAILHWTAGAPFIQHYSDAPRARDWWNARYAMTDEGPQGPFSLG